MIKAVDFLAVCANMPKDTVHKQSHGSWIHAFWLHLFSNLMSLSGLWDTFADLTNVNKHWLAIYVSLCCSLLCGTGTFVTGWCAYCYSNSFSASVVYRSTNQDGELFMLIRFAVL